METPTTPRDEEGKTPKISEEAISRRLSELPDLPPDKIEKLAGHIAENIDFAKLDEEEGVYDPISGIWIPKKQN